ncbi:MAG: coiled coil domain-containing protein [Gammaproteobacteria bacterium]|nr:hypothetical protein [Pseudomonadales bacterium]MCP5345282.1 coiled coil domain-containing protein [Pseudomonadales bacterium]
MSHRKDHEEKLKAKLTQLERDIDALKAKVKDVEGDLEHEEKVEKLHEMKEEAKHRLHELMEASDDAWDELQEGAEHYWTALGNEVKAFENFFKK